MSDLLAAVAGCYQEVAGRPAPALSPGDDVRELGLDSLQLLDLVVHLEDTLHVEITHEQMQSVRTVGDLLAALRISSR